MDDVIKEMKENLQKLAIDSPHPKDVMGKLNTILSQLSSPISRQATQISELHDSLTSEWFLHKAIFKLIGLQEPLAKNSCDGCQRYPTEPITQRWEQTSCPIQDSG